MIMGIQIVGVLFGLFMLYLTFLHQKRKEFSAKEYLFWILSWIIFIIIAIFPNILAPFVKGLRLGRIMDLLTIFGFLFVISLGIYNYFLEKNNRKKIEEIVRKIALK